MCQIIRQINNNNNHVWNIVMGPNAKNRFWTIFLQSLKYLQIFRKKYFIFTIICASKSVMTYYYYRQRNAVADGLGMIIYYYNSSVVFYRNSVWKYRYRQIDDDCCNTNNCCKVATAVTNRFRIDKTICDFNLFIYF